MPQTIIEVKTIKPKTEPLLKVVFSLSTNTIFDNKENKNNIKVTIMNAVIYRFYPIFLFVSIT
jgi:hypothetical protein